MKNLDSQAHPAEGQSWGATVISALLVLLGVGALILFGASVWQNSGIQSSLDWTFSEDIPERPSLILAFLEDFGLVFPFLILLLSSVFIVLGIRLQARHIAIARWAHMALIWFLVGLIFAALLTLYNATKPLPVNAVDTSRSDTYTQLAILVAGMFPIGLAVRWMSRHMDSVFVGQERLMSRETRLAWNLLIPTLMVIVFVAARPLEQTFIRSLTDKQFAGEQVANFVGLENYQNLLGLRVDRVDCRREDDGSCRIRDDGSIRWDSIDRQYLEEGYRTVRNIRLPFITGAEESIAISGLDDDFANGLLTTLLFTVISVSLELTIGLFIALVVNSNFSGRGFMRAVMLIPWAIPTVISARLWELILKDTSAGIVNRVGMDLGLISAPQAWLVDSSLQLPAAIMVDVWKTSPFMALLLLAGLQIIPKDLHEAASVDGATAVRRFFAITLPLLRPAIAVALVFRTLDALRVFDLFIVLFGRQQLSMATYNYEMLVNSQRDGYASAVSVIIFAFISIFAFIYVRLLNVETE